MFVDGAIKLLTQKGVRTVWPLDDEPSKCLSAFYSNYNRFPDSREELIYYAATNSNAKFSNERYSEILFRNDQAKHSFEAMYTLTNNSGGQIIIEEGKKPVD